MSRQLQAMALSAFVRQLGETPEAIRYLNMQLLREQKKELWRQAA